MLHVSAAAIGLSALLAASSAAFTLVKWAGAAYLCFIGVKMLLSRQPVPAAAAGTGAMALRQVFWQGALTNALNPKVALFFLAFLPQFVAADSPHKALAFALLGLIFVFNGTLWCLGVAAFAAHAAGRIRQSGKALAWINRALGGMFVYLGVRVAMLQAR
jgi:threonine/homoserine/homoserine lactone efflux protein